MTHDEIDRRRLLSLIASGATGAVLAGTATGVAAQTGHGAMQHPPGHGGMDHPMPVSTALPGPKPKVAMLIYPKMVLLDLVGPQTVLNIAQCEIHLVWKNRQPCQTDVGVPITPTTSFADCPADLDVLFVPGGIIGTTDCMNDPEVMAFLADRGARARYVTSVCTGGLILAAAGLLRGYRATAHWAVVDLLPIMGAIASRDRVVTDRNRISGGGVTAGIDFGLVLAAALRGEEVARRTQLTIEYAPQPPFQAGTPEGAGPELVKKVRASRVWMDGHARKAAEAAARRLKIGKA